ncbi:L-serine ammonia-lyase, iron-sulfur-dependent subunit beta [Peribacillus butanolivorans]|uniref:L-serine deaminase n=1 Tax=Peribacillus butanolivorans TaxID=421767 RepID=A0AAX0RS96_9BACI|nr:L-serine ammonia-lyase, iron-sulfur-dependent subunit beta [Peribacillus butanolivorans]AXN40494.1 L-serine ammonia-lyase, iron-sulfur-dependent, subunit beta [Peribacillus butanolivorans]PEJ35115.1 L-serine ammonia-lyase, iron-sulfur-dependent, subunit beta [Peribacillus butanolivorans]QNU05623.1 L-serine ammonia-lyase, iron-sulfur-dependent, subunit beta [Peribacillus butanolivorans]
MKFRSVFDIIGPVMIGPSSSHTAGAARIGRVARNLFNREPKWAHISFYGSFAQTYKGHGTDVAIVGGLLDFDTFDERIKESLEIARKKKMKITFREEEAVPEHPNTAKITVGDDDGELELVGISIGGGKIEIIELNGFKLRLSGHNPAILVVHDDRFGAIASVSNILAKHQINIGQMEVSRKEKGKMALMTIEVDHNLEDLVIDEIAALPNITQVARIVD